ncbi:Gamma-glutamylcyclotransferase [Fusarium sp. LHS14.1]|nr:Gamma-glutamylcyclotransferase [Fusarium sp. LHS14.1]
MILKENTRSYTQTMQSSTLPRTRKPDVLYFAYGSNLHVAQMAKRCPSSVFIGTGTLPGYRWQINERGVANVVPEDDSSVEGLVYLVNARDVRALDRSEGVARKLYQKHMLEIVLQRHRQYSSFTSARLAHVLEEASKSSDQGSGQASQSAGANSDSDREGSSHQHGPPSQRQQRPYRPLDVKALVYVSENYATDGTIREEYIARMRNAVSSASTLGVSQSFLDKYIAPHLKPDDEEPSIPDQVQEGVQEEKQQEEKQEDEKEEGKADESPDTAASNDATTSNTADKSSGQVKETQDGQREGRFDAVIVGACVLATAGWCSMTLL